MLINIPRFMIAAPMSGSGKTTVTCGILKALMNRKRAVAAFKSGPDYIDPMFHREVIGVHSRNLDMFLLGKGTVKYLLAKNSWDKDIAVLEGAMGYYDGLGRGTEGSAYDLACATQTPVILCVNAKGAAISLAALIKGFIDFRKDSNIRGVILNNVNPMVYKYYKESVEKEIGIPLVGYLPHLPECSLESRHLGLITAEEIVNLQDIISILAEQIEQSIDLDLLVSIAAAASELEYEDKKIIKIGDCTIAIARDKAFSFYYQDALDLLTELGAELVFFSPLQDKSLPPCDGVILGGGYPEVYARELSENVSILSDLRMKIINGLPTIAECGGFMYLLEHFAAADDICSWGGVLRGQTFLTKSLTRFGYVTLTAQWDNVLCAKGESINAHEFHYSDSTSNGKAFFVQKTGGKGHYYTGHATKTMYAGYPHLHLWGNIAFAQNFIRAALTYQKKM